ncbi:MAG: HAD family hydrolase [Geminicoccaceae bacterium]|nr:MAG: HAD family hydrolase [Geminicoccaceae bacterium]
MARQEDIEVDGQTWHALSVDETLDALRSDPERGLDEDEAKARRKRFGENRLTPPTKRTALQRFFAQLDNLFIYLLLAAAALAAFLGEWIDAGVIVGVVAIIVVIGFIQEGRAEKSLEAVQGMLSPKAQVLRNKRRRERPAEELVPGDIVVLDAGDRVPADVRLVKVKSFQTQEAALTGESTSVEKGNDAVDADAELGDRKCLAFSGTTVTGGRALGVVVATGDATEIGRISSMLSEVETLKTPLMQRLDVFTKQLSVVIVGLALLTLAVGVLVWARPWGEMALAAVAIAVATIPEGLPAIMTVTLAIGVRRMAARNAIIRRLPAVETLGSVTSICSDKTGTLTKNEMTVKTLRTAGVEVEVGGVGYEPHGKLRVDGDEIDLEEHGDVRELLRAGLLCNDSDLRQEGDGWVPEGDPMEAALIALARKAGFEPDREHDERPRLDVIPFASERRYMATLNHDHDKNHFLYVKGAPERVMEMCTKAARDGETVELDEDAWRNWSEAIAERGQRVIAVARKDVDALQELTEEDAEADLVFLGLVGLIDPPREEAIDAVEQCRSAGIRVKMITGDHATTAAAIAEQLGLERTDRVVTGREIEEMSDDDLRGLVEDVDVFARASPEHKLRLVKALQAENVITAMTGDGVNDAPALKRADIGIAMGQKGTDAAREASEMVLADDNFASIERAVEEGRVVYDNLKKAIIYLLPTNAAQGLVIVVAILLGLTLPVTPVQALWINMVTAVTLGMALAWERAEGDVMQRPPRPSDEPLLTPFMLWRIAFVGLIIWAFTGGGFVLFYEYVGGTAEHARTVAVNTLVTCQIFYLINARFMTAAAYNADGFFGSRPALIAIVLCALFQLLFTYAPFMQLLFDTEPLGLTAWAWCLSAGVIVFVLVEMEKAVIRRRNGNGMALAKGGTG